MYIAAALMSQREFGVFYIELELSSNTSKKGYKEDRFNIILELSSSEEQFNDWKSRYMNRASLIEPITYDASINLLRDSLRMQKNKRDFQ